MSTPTPPRRADLDGGGRRDDAVHGARPGAAARSGRRRSPRRCRRPRGRGCAGSARWRCRRTRRPAVRTCPSRSRPRPCAALSFNLARRDRSYRRSYGGADDPQTAGRARCSRWPVAGAPAGRRRGDGVTTTTLPVDVGNHSVIPAAELRPGPDRSRGPGRMGPAAAVRRALRGLGDRVRPRPVGRPPAQPGQPDPLVDRDVRAGGPDGHPGVICARARRWPRPVLVCGRAEAIDSGFSCVRVDLAAPTSNPSRPERALDPVRAGRGVGAPGVSGGRRRIDVTAVSARWSFPFCAHACDHGSYPPPNEPLVVTDGTGLVPASLHPHRREINPLTPGSIGARRGGRRPSAARR